MDTAILTVHIVVCLVLVILVLLQAGREGMGVIFGGSSSSTFGAAGAGGLLTKLTTFLAVLFVITSLTYNILTGTPKKGESTLLNVQFEEVIIPPVPTTPTETNTTTDTMTSTEAPVSTSIMEPAEVTISTDTMTPVDTMTSTEVPMQNSTN